MQKFDFYQGVNINAPNVFENIKRGAVLGVTPDKKGYAVHVFGEEEVYSFEESRLEDNGEVFDRNDFHG